MQLTSIILDCSSFNLVITPLRRPFMTLHVSEVKLIRLINGILYLSRVSFRPTKMPSDEQSVIPMVSRCLVKIELSQGLKNLTRIVKSFTESPLSFDSSHSKLKGCSLIVSIIGFLKCGSSASHNYNCFGFCMLTSKILSNF